MNSFCTVLNACKHKRHTHTSSTVVSLITQFAHRVNNDIFSRCLNVVFPDGAILKLSRRDALKAAAERRLDLVEFKSNIADSPPVAKLVCYKKLRQERREEHQAAVMRGRQADAGSGELCVLLVAM